MSRRWYSEEEFDVPMTPLIDIIFILLVFFLVATTFYTEERDLDIQLPEGTEGGAIAQDDEPFIINIRQSGVIVVHNEILSMDDLESKLKGLVAADKGKVEVRGDADCRHRHIMGVMNLCKKTGIAEYSLTQRIQRED
jgi:biopolymer transport protein ExbD